jgi:hypothetical protein
MTSNPFLHEVARFASALEHNDFESFYSVC